MMQLESIVKEKRILVVEDDASINRLISYNLSRNGFNPESVFDGYEAQSRLAQEVFDIVVLDIMLPGVDGFRICKTIKENPSAFKTFVIMVTARAESQDKIYGHLMGADYYLPKPFSVMELMDIVKELIRVREKDYVVKNPAFIIKKAATTEG